MTRRRITRLCLCAFLVVAAIQAIRHAGSVPRDFGVRYAAGEAVRRGLDPYDAELNTALVADAANTTFEEEYGFHDPPIVAEVFRPLSMLPVAVAARLWLALSFFAAAASGALTLALIGWWRNSPDGWLAAAVVGVGFAPFTAGIELGQVDPVYAAIALVGLTAIVRRSRPVLGGALLALSVLKPQLGLGTAVAAATTRVRTLLAGVVTGGALLLLPLVVGSSASYSRWRATLEQHSYPGWFRLVTGLCLLCSVVVVGLLRPRLDDAVTRFSVGACLSTIAFSFVYLNPMSAALLIVPAALVTKSLQDGPAPVWIRVVASTAGALLVYVGLSPWVYFGGISSAIIPIGMAALLFIAAIATWGRPRPEVVAVAAGNAVVVAAGVSWHGVAALSAVAATLLLVALSWIASQTGAVTASATPPGRLAESHL